MPQISGMVFEGQDPETRLNDVITSASWITAADMGLVQQGKAEVLDKIANENWVAPYMWTINWINIPPQEAQQEVSIDIQNGGGFL